MMSFTHVKSSTPLNSLANLASDELLKLLGETEDDNLKKEIVNLYNLRLENKLKKHLKNETFVR